MVIVMRGVSGAGKSTYTSKFGEGRVVHVVSADKFFLDKETGEYRFNALKLGEAHASCLKEFVSLCQGAYHSQSLIVVDNTNTTVAEMAPYMAVAAAYGHDTKVVTIDCDPEVAAARNVHGVPVQTVKAQHDRIVKETKNMPPWWSHEVHLHESRLGEV